MCLACCVHRGVAGWCTVGAWGGGGGCWRMGRGGGVGMLLMHKVGLVLGSNVYRKLGPW